MCRESGKRGRERINQTQNQRVRGHFLPDWLYFVFFPPHIREERKIVGTNSEGFIFLAELKPNLTLHISSVIFFPPFFCFCVNFVLRWL